MSENEQAPASLDAAQSELRQQWHQLEVERSRLRRQRQAQRVWWAALLALGFALGYATAEWIIDPVTIIVPEGSGISV